MIGRALPADTDVFLLSHTRIDRKTEHLFYGGIALVKSLGNGPARVRIHGQSELRQIVRANRGAFQIFEEFVGKNRVWRDRLLRLVLHPLL